MKTIKTVPKLNLSEESDKKNKINFTDTVVPGVIKH
jgi:hypothetical protein